MPLTQQAVKQACDLYTTHLGYVPDFIKNAEKNISSIHSKSIDNCYFNIEKSSLGDKFSFFPVYLCDAFHKTAQKSTGIYSLFSQDKDYKTLPNLMLKEFFDWYSNFSDKKILEQVSALKKRIQLFNELFPSEDLKKEREIINRLFSEIDLNIYAIDQALSEQMRGLQENISAFESMVTGSNDKFGAFLLAEFTSSKCKLDSQINNFKSSINNKYTVHGYYLLHCSEQNRQEHLANIIGIKKDFEHLQTIMNALVCYAETNLNSKLIVDLKSASNCLMQVMKAFTAVNTGLELVQCSIGSEGGRLKNLEKLLYEPNIGKIDLHILQNPLTPEAKEQIFKPSAKKGFF